MSKRLSALHRLAFFTASSVLLLHGAVSYADDTEIFFGGAAIDDSVRPNVLFVLDNSGSMAWRTASNANPSGNEKSRMQILKESFSSIINSAGAINAGIMVLNERSAYGNTRMVYPVSNIDNTMPNNAQLVASTPEILVSGDDAMERTDISSNATINDSVLLMGNIATTTTISNTPYKLLDDTDAFFLKTSSGQDYACRMNKPNRSGSAVCNNNNVDNINIRTGGDNSTANPVRGTSLLYFRSIRNSDGSQIPAAARLVPGVTAYLDLRPTASAATRPDIQITIERSKNPTALNDSSQIGARTYLSTVTLKPDSWNSSQTAQIDITQTIKDLLAIDGLPLDNVFVTLRATNNNDYTFCTRQCGSGNVNAPRIRINYDSTATSTESRMGGLRFQNVGIPQGATVTSARIDFAPASGNSDPVTFAVRAARVDDASVFTTSTDMSGSTKTVAVSNWAAPAWVNTNPPVHVEGPNVTSLVQEVVNRSGWCGNNAMAFYLEPISGSGSRTAHSIDGAPGLQPTLTITYTGGSGCLNPIIEASVTNPKNDAYQEAGGTTILGSNTLPIASSRFAARFEGVPILNGANILDARLILTPANTVTGANVTTTLRFENADNSAAFTATSNNLSGRSTTTSSSCVINSWVDGTPYSCSASTLRDALQNVINRAGWSTGNALTLLGIQSSNSSLNIQAYESNPAEAIKLRIKVASGGVTSSTYTVRNHLNALVQSMNASDGTPIVPTMNEAARYLRGTRPGYESPITSACQTTHLVVLTDGQANGNGAQSSIGTLTGSTCTGDATDTNEQCGRSLATWMAATDQSSTAGDNFITTHTIGFALGALAPNTQAQTFLNALANNGKGRAYTAENASQLSAAFSKILQDVLSTDTTFVSPGATVNQFNRQSNKNEVYFALFKPSDSNRWVGNLKRYGLNSSSGDIIIDADNVGAIDSNTGFFKATARSFWTTGSDGNNTALGGVANKLPSAASRKVYTYTGNSPASPVNLNAAAYLLNNANTANVTEARLNAANATERTALINWIRGLNDDSTARNAIGDPLHSVPRLVTYECSSFTDSTLTTCASERQSVFIGTNEGFVHAFNTNTGVEQMAFMPQELLGNIKALKANEESTTLAPRKYGMDNTVVTWVNDVNGNGVIYGGRDPSKTVPTLLPSGLNSGEFVYAYATMGRGGNNLYSLDVTDVDNPKMRWFITPSTPGFSKLGQTWSTPLVTKININGTSTPVLMFAGGYDDTQDEVSILNRNKDGSPRAQDSQGTAIYIVDAVTGALIWSGSNQVSNAAAQAHQQLSKMIYSIPSSLRAIDINRDGFADQFFVGDMGGQVWRFFINNGNTVSSLVSPIDSGAGTIDDGVFASVIPADVGGESTQALKGKLRRFYNEPDIALLTVNEGKTLLVNIGSGYRGHPLDTGANDRFYSFRTPLIESNAQHTVLTESAMYDATLNLIQEGSATQKAAAAAAFGRVNGGWYIRLENPGEKVLSESTTFAGKVFFNTYEPNASAANNSCKAVQGVGRAYAVNLFDATPISQMVSGTPDRTDRSKALLTAGIPPKGITLFPEGSESPPLCIGTECEELDVDITVGPTYWIDEI